MNIWGAWLLGEATREITLFAAVGVLIGAIDDVAIDLLWMARTAWRRLTVYRRYPRTTAATLPPPDAPGRIAIFVPAWQEADVIERMLRTTLARIEHGDYTLYVGTYPNDPATIAAVQAVRDPRVRLVRGELPGPTTKAECLNRLWAALRRDELHGGARYKAVVVHDAEDVVHPQELRLFDCLIERFDLIQLPVLPLVDKGSRWISGHYVDEFAVSHGRQLAVREALGAGLPLAGVGCAIGRDALGRMAHQTDGHPFDETSLTEDYEMGLRLRAFGGRAAFVVMPAAPGAGLVATRAFFPGTFEAAIRQKTRWILGIAFAGWDRLGWRGGLAERWMRVRDRRAVLAALIIAAAYMAMILSGLCVVLRVDPVWPRWAEYLLAANLLLLCWRLLIRFATVTRFYGWREGGRAVPRLVIANCILMVAARRAFFAYVPGTVPAWDKTAHHFPEQVPCD